MIRIFINAEAECRFFCEWYRNFVIFSRSFCEGYVMGFGTGLIYYNLFYGFSAKQASYANNFQSKWCGQLYTAFKWFAYLYKFVKILRFLRFDDKNDRNSKIGHDKFVLIRKLKERFISNSQASYEPSKYFTADEQLLPCCSFIQYIPNKPDKFGIKFWLLCKVETKYTCRGFPYLRRDEDKNQVTYKDDEQGCLIASYQCKPKKFHVILISTDHEEAVIPSLDFNCKKKPSVILTYNSKKVGVDSVDQMSRIYIYV